MDTKKIEEALKSRFGGNQNARFEVIFDEQNNSLTIRTNLLHKIDQECNEDEDCCMKVISNKIIRELVFMTLTGFLDIHRDRKTGQVIIREGVNVKIEPL
jgi:hypothetical protein